MVYARYLLLLCVFQLIGCVSVGGSYKVSSTAELANLFVYMPDTLKKTNSAVLVYVDKKSVGEISENSPLQFAVTTGWHTLVVHRKSPLGAREELATVNIFTEKDKFYYVRFEKGVSTSALAIVDENTGRQMK